MQPKPFSLHSLGLKATRLMPWIAIAGLLFYNLSFLRAARSLADFGSFIASGQAASQGKNPYGIYPLTSHAEFQGRVEYYPNLNPPVLLPVFEGLAQFNPRLAWQGWRVLSLTLYVVGLILLFRIYRPAAIWFGWGLALAGFWDTLVLGQIYTWLFFVAAVAWILLDHGRDLSAGILIGILAAIKPNLLLWPTLLFVAGFRRPAIWSFAVALVLSVLPVLRYGYQVYLQWFDAVSQVGWISMPHYLSLFGLTARLGVPWLGLVLALLLMISAAWWCRKRQPARLQTSGIALISSILASPLATPRFVLLLVPFSYSRPRKDYRTIVLEAFFLIPTSLLIWISFQSYLIGLILGLIFPVVLLALLLGIRYGIAK